MILTERLLQRLRCPDCDAATRAKLPPEAPASAFGPRLCAALVTLAVRNRISRRDAVELAGELFGARICAGSVEAILQRAATALDEPCEDLLCHIRAAPAVNIDETGWRTAGERRTLWGALTGQKALFRIAADRHRREAQALLGEDFSGIACSDRGWAYNYLDAERRQLRWAHLVRDLTARSGGLAAQKEFGAAGLENAARLFAAWNRCRWTLTAPASASASARSSRNFGRCSSRRRARAPATAPSPATCSDAGRSYGPSRAPPVSSPPTTTPSAACAGRSSTASSRSAASPLGGAHHRAAAVGLGRWPPTGALVVRLPQRRPCRQDPRRPHPLLA